MRGHKRRKKGEAGEKGKTVKEGKGRREKHVLELKLTGQEERGLDEGRRERGWYNHGYTN